MGNLKAIQALALLESPIPAQPPDPPYSLSVRIPGEMANRVFQLIDQGLPEHWAQPNKGNTNKPFLSRNALVIALIEAGLEAVEAVAVSNQPIPAVKATKQLKGKKNA